jgi:hypothetical protein
MRRLAVAALGALTLAAPATAGTPTATVPVYDARGNLVETPFTPARQVPLLTEERATALFVAEDKVADWLERYPEDVATEATFDEETRSWTVKAWWGEAGQIALGKVDDARGRVTEAWTGPQVAWKMARGYDGAFGGKTLNRPLVWVSLSLVFLLGLANLRRPLCMRNLDLLVLLSFSVSLWFFDRGEIFTSVPLVYPPLVYLVARLAWIGARRVKPPAMRPLWPVWLLAAATVFLLGFRVGLNVEAPFSVIDVGYSGVIGAHRIATGESPYGHFPVAADLKPCAEPNADGEVRQRIQTNGRCEYANERGDTYGPVAYAAYVPGYWLFGWSGGWPGDELWAAHFTSLVFDLICLLGLVLVGLRFGGARLGATLAFAWAAYPFTQYVSNSNTNDAVLPAFLIWGFWLASAPWARGALVALSGWTKFASLLVVPLWLTYPDAARIRSWGRFAAGFALATAAAFLVLLLEPDVLDAARVFWDRSIAWQVGRESPFSIWDWGQYHAAGIPDLHVVQRVLQLLLVVAAVAVAFVPRRKSPLQLAALTGALLAGFQLVLTHWFYLYIPWFFPFAAFALLATVTPAGERERASEPGDSERRELVATG